jgi:hypothetical protein
LDDLAHKGEPAVIKISDALVETVEDFWVWTMSLKPRIEEQTQLHRVVRLGIFAWRYQIHALSNQVADVIRSSTGRGEWCLDAEIVDNIYATLPEECGLRKVFREQLQKLSPAAIMRDQVTQQQWKTTFLKHSQIGWDYVNRKENERNTFVIRPSSCSFHDHSQHSDNGGLPMITGSGCPYAEWECFPSGEEDLIQTKVMVKEPAQKDEMPFRGRKSKKGKKMQKKAQSHSRASESEQIPAAEATTSPEPESAKVLYEETTLCEEATPCNEVAPYEEATFCDEAPPCEEATFCDEEPHCEEATPCDEAAPYDEAASCDEAKSCEEAAPCDEATPYEDAASYEEAAPCEEAPPCDEATPYEEAACEEKGPVNEALMKQPIATAEGIVSGDDCSDEWVRREEEFYGP